MKTEDSKANGMFPSAPIQGSSYLVPIRSWAGMHQEIKITGVVFDEFWYESVEEGVAYFFSWLGNPRCTVLVVWDDTEPTHIECRKIGDQLVSENEAETIRSEIIHEFRKAGFWSDLATH